MICNVPVASRIVFRGRSRNVCRGWTVMTQVDGLANLDMRAFKLMHRRISLSESQYVKKVYHMHQGMEFMYIHQGVGRVVVDRRVYDFKPGSLLFFQPFQLHRLEIKMERGKEYLRTVVVFEPAVFDRHLRAFQLLRSFMHLLWKGTHVKPVVDASALDGTLSLMFQQLHDRMHDVSQPQRQEEETLFVLSFLQLLRPYYSEEAVQSHSTGSQKFQHVQQIMNWVGQHYKEEFRLNHLSRELHLSPTYASSLFRQSTGSSIVEYLTALRMREACQLLKTTSSPIQEIAMEIGLTNVSYFIQLFKRNMGVTPMQYRIS